MDDLFAKVTPCASCGQPVRWITTSRGNPSPIDPKAHKMLVLRPGSEIADVVDAYISHFSTCPTGHQHGRVK